MAKVGRMQYFVHNGYSGWSYGTPSDPQLIAEKDALLLIDHAGLTLEEISTSLPPAEFAETESELYFKFGKNRFLQFGDITQCADVDKQKASRPLKIVWNAI